MSLAQMRREIATALSTIGSSPLRDTLINSGYIYTAYVSTLIWEALRTMAPSEVYISVQNPWDGLFRFPMGRSEIYSGRASWYEINARGQTWEIHLCCECDGVSRLQHELDIMILKKQTADDCRANRRRPHTDEVIFLVECKNVGAVQFSLGREFLGLCWEFPSEDPSSRQWQWRGQRRLGAMVSTLPASPTAPSAFRLIAARDLIARSSVAPDGRYVTDFQQDIVNVLRPIFIP